MQEPVLEMGALDLDMVGQLEHALEGARGDALIQRIALVLLGLGLLLATDRQRVLLRHDRELRLGEARHRDANAVCVVAGALDVVGRVGGSAAVVSGQVVEEGEQMVEADSRTIEGSKIESSHGISSLLSDMRMVRPQGAGPVFCAAPLGLHSPYMGALGRPARGNKLLLLNANSVRLSSSFAA